MKHRLIVISAIITAIIIAMAYITTLIYYPSYEETGCLRKLKAVIIVAPRTWHDSVVGFEEYFESRGIAFEELNIGFLSKEEAAKIVREKLRYSNLIIIPGGWAYSYYASLGIEGLNEVVYRVHRGAIYIGVCAGAYLAAKSIVWEKRVYTYSLGLVDAEAIGPLPKYPWPTMATISIIIEDKELERLIGKEDVETTYFGGPFFNISKADKKIKVLASYSVEDGGGAAIIVGSYGKGVVILSGPHIELKEDGWKILDYAILLACKSLRD